MGIYYRTADNNSWALELPLFGNIPLKVDSLMRHIIIIMIGEPPVDRHLSNWYISGYAVQEYIYKPTVSARKVIKPLF